MAEVDAGLMAQAVKDWQRAGHGQKEAALTHWLPVLGRGRRKHEQMETWVEMIMRLKYNPPKGVRSLATADAVRLAKVNGLVPLSAELSEGTVNRVARELGLMETARKEVRFEAEFPNQVHQIDASGSDHFFPVRKTTDGDWLLKLRPKQQKNKEKADKFKLWAYGLADDFSGYRLSRYTVAPGESAAGSIAFLQWAWAKDEEHAPFRGLPEILYSDNGPLVRKHAFQEFAARVGVTLKTHEAERAQATGKVEANWKSLWKRFETPWFFAPGWEKLEITLAELNQEVAAFWRQWNHQRHRHLALTREAAWLLIQQRGGVVDIAPEAWRTVFQRHARKIDAAGCFDFKGRTYQVQKIHACDAWLYEGLVDNCIVVEDRRDGQRYGCSEFAPLVWGEYKGVAKTALERLKDEPSPVAPGVKPSWREESGSNVVHLVRAEEVKDGDFALPEAAAPVADLTLAAMAATVVRGQESGVSTAAPELYATPLERYTALRIRAARGERLAVADAAYIRDFEIDFAEQYALVREDVERRVRLAVVE